MKSSVSRKPKRRGVEVVEFALVLPLIMLLFFGAIEAARAVMVVHTLQEAAQSGCRVYSMNDTTQADATSIIAEAMADAGITSYSVAFKPTIKADVDVPGEQVSVTVSASFSKVAWLSPAFFSGKSLQGTCVFPADVQASDGGDRNGYQVSDDDNQFDGIFRYDDDDD